MLQGNTTYKGITLPAAAPGPPFPANSADNGLSVDPVTGRIVLGNDVGGLSAALLSDREIEMSNFFFRMNNAGGSVLNIDPLAAIYGLGDLLPAANGSSIFINDTTGLIQLSVPINGFPGSAALELDGGNNRYKFGDLTGANNQSHIDINDAVSQINMFANLGKSFGIDNAIRFYEFGDLSGLGTSTKIEIDDSQGAFSYFSGGNNYMLLNAIADQYFMGNALPGGMFLDIQAATQKAEIKQASDRFLLIDKASDVFQFGDIDATGDGMALSFYGGGYSDWGDTNSLNNNTVFSVDDSIEQCAAFANGDTMLDLRRGTNIYRIGRCTGGGNTRLSIDDNTGIFDIRNGALTAGITINNVAGFTGTVTPVTSITVNAGIVTAVT